MGWQLLVHDDHDTKPERTYREELLSFEDYSNSQRKNKLILKFIDCWLKSI
jgi:hypothetical protein